MKCPSCGTQNLDDEIFCTECGADMVRAVRMKAPKVKCPKCGELNIPGESSCEKCRSRLPTSFVICPDCARENLKSERWCVFCDAKLEAEVLRTPEPEAPTEAPAVAPAAAKVDRVLCPKCSVPMEPGYLIVRSNGYAVRWSSEPDNFWGTVGVPVLAGDLWKPTISMQGFRCSTCRVVTVRY